MNATANGQPLVATLLTPCQRCGELFENTALPEHIARHYSGELPTLPIGEVFQRVMGDQCSFCSETLPAHAAPCPIAKALRQRETQPPAVDAEGLPKLPLSILLEAVMCGGTLVISGPGSIAPSPQAANTFGASLESETGARHAHSVGATLAQVLSDLAQKWVLQ